MPKLPTIRLIWHSPRMFSKAGLYLRIGNWRARIVKVGTQ